MFFYVSVGLSLFDCSVASFFYVCVGELGCLLGWLVGWLVGSFLCRWASSLTRTLTLPANCGKRRAGGFRKWSSRADTESIGTSFFLLYWRTSEVSDRAATLFPLLLEIIIQVVCRIKIRNYAWDEQLCVKTYVRTGNSVFIS